MQPLPMPAVPKLPKPRFPRVEGPGNDRALRVLATPAFAEPADAAPEDAILPPIPDGNVPADASTIPADAAARGVPDAGPR